MTKEDFPRRLREWREANGLSQRALASRLEICEGTYRSYEHGARPSFDVCEKIEALTGIGIKIKGRRCHKWQNTPLTPEEQRFAAEHYPIVEQFIRIYQLRYDEWYDIVVMGYLIAVQIWFFRKDLHTYSFVTITKNTTYGRVTKELKRLSKLPKTVSLDDIIILSPARTA